MRLGVVGTMVWDTIHGAGEHPDAPVEEWGGIAYALAAADAALPEEWSIFPIIKVGADLRERVDEFLASLDRIESLEGVRTVPEPNNRVELFHHTAGRRCEKLTGRVPGWELEEIVPLAQTCDALYVNFISGWELDLRGASGLRAAVSGPVYCDLHSLMLGVENDGMRRLRPLESWSEWLGAFDIVQMNEDELTTLADGREDPWSIAGEIVGGDSSAVLVTLGDRGAAWASTSGFLSAGVAPGASLPNVSGEASEGTVVRGRVDPELVVENADPTGCGDVWGATCFAGLLSGVGLQVAIRAANRAASRNASYRGATGLNECLRSSSGLVFGGGLE